MFTEDFNAYLGVDDFAVAATWTPTGGVAVAVRLIFFDGYVDTASGPGLVAGHRPMCLVSDEQVSAIARGDAMAITGNNYEVIDVIPDGTGFTRLTFQGPIPSEEGIGFQLEDGSGSITQESGDPLVLEDGSSEAGGFTLEDGSGDLTLEDGSQLELEQ